MNCTKCKKLTTLLTRLANEHKKLLNTNCACNDIDKIINNKQCIFCEINDLTLSYYYVLYTLYGDMDSIVIYRFTSVTERDRFLHYRTYTLGQGLFIFPLQYIPRIYKAHIKKWENEKHGNFTYDMVKINID